MGSKVGGRGDPIGLGVLIRRDGLHAVAVNLDGDVLEDSYRMRPLGPEQPVPVEQVVDGIGALVAELLDRWPSDRGEVVVGLGVAVWGHVNLAGEVVESPALGWRQVRLPELLTAATGIDDVLVHHDVSALALAEQSFGVGRERSSFAVVTCRWGLGCSLVLHNELVRGDDGAAAELGHVVFDPDGPDCSCGNRGCLEMLATPKAVVERVRGAGLAHVESPLEVIDLARAGDETALAALRSAETMLGRGLALLTNLVNPGLVILYGQPEVLGAEPYREATLTALRRSSFPTRHCDVVIKPNADQMAARGVASEVLQLVAEPSPARSGLGSR